MKTHSALDNGLPSYNETELPSYSEAEIIERGYFLSFTHWLLVLVRDAPLTDIQFTIEIHDQWIGKN